MDNAIYPLNNVALIISGNNVMKPSMQDKLLELNFKALLRHKWIGNHNYLNCSDFKTGV